MKVNRSTLKEIATDCLIDARHLEIATKQEKPRLLENLIRNLESLLVHVGDKNGSNN